MNKVYRLRSTMFLTFSIAYKGENLATAKTWQIRKSLMKKGHLDRDRSTT